MGFADPFVLAEGVVLTPTRDLSEDHRRSIEGGEDDFVISRPNSRTTAKVIDSGAAELIRRFTSPQTIAQAVARYSRGRAESAERQLEEALPLLQSLIAAGLLVPPDSGRRRKIEPSLGTGDVVDGWRIVRCIQVLDDTDLYVARGASAQRAGELAALKIGQQGCSDEVWRMLSREARIISVLDRSIAPPLLQSGEWNSRPYLLTEWFPGVDAQTACEELGRDGASGWRGRLHLAGAILRAYASLHEHGVIHGDVHPRNVLVDRRQSVRLIDFGFARSTAEADPDGFPERAGVGFFFEPEFAAALAKGAAPPPSSMAGEQYALAALLYLLLSGKHYLDFSLERQEMMRQITQDAMVPLTSRGLDAWPEIEEVLARALSKDPSHRHASVLAFAETWDPAAARAPDPKPRHPQAASATKATLAKMRARLLQSVGLNGPLLAGGPLPPPTASLNYGSAGIACALYRIACGSDDAELLSLADVWCARAIRELPNEEAFYNRDLEVTPETVGRRSLFHSAVGVHAVEALIARARGDALSRAGAVSSFLAAAAEPCDGPGLGLDVTLGRAGVLLACVSLLGGSANGGETSERLRAFGRETLDHIWGTLDGLAPVPESRELTNLGIAHGWAGLLYATLTWCASTGNSPPPRLAERLDELSGCAEPAGRGLQWKWDLARSPAELGGTCVPGWCNGSAGYVFLWTQAHQRFGEPKFLKLAEGAAWNAWETRHAIGNLCCGIAGQAYALLNLYRHTKEAVWLRRAFELAGRAASVASDASLQTQLDQLALRPESLYKGELGIIVLDSDLNQPEFARMPMFEPEG